MEVTYVLGLPRDAASVPFVRHMCRTSLERLGVASVCISDIEIAVSEACTNVLRHASESDDEYEVRVRIDQLECEISVADTGGTLDVASISTTHVTPGAEGGRGMFLMKALVDDLNFVSDRVTGTVVRLRKNLDLLPNSVLSHVDHAHASARDR